MIYYPLSTLMLTGVRDVMVITTPADASLFARVLADVSQWRMNIGCAAQAAPRRIAEAVHALSVSKCTTGYERYLLPLGL